MPLNRSALSLPAVSDVMASLLRSVSSCSTNGGLAQNKLSIEFANIAGPIKTVSMGQADVLREVCVKGIADVPIRRTLSVP